MDHNRICSAQLLLNQFPLPQWILVPTRLFVVLKVATIRLLRNVRIAGDIVAIDNVRGRDATNVRKEPLDFVLPMAVAGDVRSLAATKGHVTNFSVQRKCIVFVFFLIHEIDVLIDDFTYHFSHGGGKRCRKEGCSKSAVGGSQFCTGTSLNMLDNATSSSFFFISHIISCNYYQN